MSRAGGISRPQSRQQGSLELKTQRQSFPRRKSPSHGSILSSSKNLSKNSPYSRPLVTFKLVEQVKQTESRTNGRSKTSLANSIPILPPPSALPRINYPQPHHSHIPSTTHRYTNTAYLTHILDLPIRVTKRFMDLVPLDDLASCMSVCSAWFNLLREDGVTEHPIWKRHCQSRMPDDVLNATYLHACRTHKSKLRALIHAWNPHDCSPNATVHHFSFARNQIPQTTDGCRARIGFREGKHVWQIIWKHPLGSNACIGVATRSTVLVHKGYVPLIGSDRHSWGWNLVNNTLHHKGAPMDYYPPDPKIKFKVGDIIYVLLDCDNKTLSFNKNGDYLGVAFENLPVPHKELFPAISAVYGGTTVLIVYMGQLHESRINFS